MLIDRNKKTFKNKLKRIQKVEYMWELVHNQELKLQIQNFTEN